MSDAASQPARTERDTTESAGVQPTDSLNAVDRLVLDEAKPIVFAHDDAGTPLYPDEVVVVGASAPELADAVADTFGWGEGARLRQSADADPTTLGLVPELVAGARLVVGRLPKHLAELEELAELIARHADSDVRVVLGGRVKHMTHSMSDTLGSSFGNVYASLGRQKSRVLHASEPRESVAATYPRVNQVVDAPLGLDLQVSARGAVFAGARLDLGTRVLLGELDALLASLPASPDAVLDLGCGTGLLAIAAAQRLPEARVIATDRSWAAATSATETVALAGLADRIDVCREISAAGVPDASVDLVLLNPPFHDDYDVIDDMASDLFAAAARVLRPGGTLVTVFNSHLRHQSALERAVGPTRQLTRTTKFTVTASTRR